MKFTGPPQVTMDDTPYNITLSNTPALVPSYLGNFTEAISYNISKYLFTEDSTFMLDRIDYTKFNPDPSNR